MQFPTAQSFRRSQAPNTPSGYSSEALRQDLERVRNVWDDSQGTRDRNAIYGTLTQSMASWLGGQRMAGRSTVPVGLCDCNGCRFLIGRTRSLPSFGARRPQKRPTSEREANGAASCDTRRRTSRIPSPWSSSYAGRVASMRAPPVSYRATIWMRTARQSG